MLEPSSKTIQTAILVVPPEQDAKRLDLFLVSQMPGFSRTQVQALLDRKVKGIAYETIQLEEFRIDKFAFIGGPKRPLRNKRPLVAPNRRTSNRDFGGF